MKAVFAIILFAFYMGAWACDREQVDEDYWSQFVCSQDDFLNVISAADALHSVDVISKFSIKEERQGVYVFDLLHKIKKSEQQKAGAPQAGYGIITYEIDFNEKTIRTLASHLYSCGHAVVSVSDDKSSAVPTDSDRYYSVLVHDLKRYLKSSRQ